MFDRVLKSSPAKTSVIRQMGELQNGCYKKTKHAKKYSSGDKKYSFFGEFGMLCVLVL